MKTNCFLLAASIMLALFMFSCSEDPSPPAPTENNRFNGPYTGCNVRGICTGVETTNAEGECSLLGGKIDYSCVFQHCKIGGACTPIPEENANTNCHEMGGSIAGADNCTNPPYGSSNPSGGGGNGPWTGCKVSSGICMGVNIDNAQSECQTLGGAIDNTCVFKHCKYANGTCTPVAESIAQQACQAGSGTIVDVGQCNYTPSNPGGNQLPSNGQYCFDDEGDCSLIGTDRKCLYGSKEECEYWDGTVRDLQWCQTNAGSSNTYGCVFDY